MPIHNTIHDTPALTHCRRAGVRRAVSAWALSIWLLTLLACSFGKGVGAGEAAEAVSAASNALHTHTHAHPGTGDESTLDDFCCDLLQLTAIVPVANANLAPLFQLFLSAPALIALWFGIVPPPFRTYRFSHPPNTKPFLHRIANSRWPNAPPRAVI